MMRPKYLGFTIAIAALFVAAMPLRASDPIGVYGVIDKVVFEPNEASATAVQVWGAFSLAVPRSPNGQQTKPAGSFGDDKSGDVYAAVQKGYLYFTCPKAKETLCRNEWNDLKATAGKKDVVGFGSRWVGHATVRSASEKPASPDEYVSQAGV